MNRRVSIITVSYNSEKFIEKYVRSILKNFPEGGEVIVFDNASDDQTVVLLKQFLPKIKLIESKENLGFAKGNNRAAKMAKSRYLFFLNPDTELEKPIFDELISFYEKNSEIGIVGPRLILPDGKVQPSVRNIPTLWGAFKEYILGIEHSYSGYIPPTTQPIEIESIYGAAMLIKSNLFWEISGFDEKYFLYYEDIDLCRRVRELNKKIYYYPALEVMHLVGATSSPSDKYELNYESFLKYHGKFKAFLFQLIFLIHRLQRRLKLF